MREANKKPGIVRTETLETTAYEWIELDEPARTAIITVAKSQIVRECQFVASLGACLAIILTAVFGGLSYYFSGNYPASQAVVLPAIAGICGMIILTYAYHRP